MTSDNYVLMYCCFRKLIIFSVIIPLFYTIAHAQEKALENSKVSVSLGYNQEDFSWSIAGNLQGKNPNIYSELNWDNLHSLGANLTVNLNVWKRFYLGLNHAHYSIYKGTATDTDYLEDNRQNVSYFALLRSNNGYIRHSSAAIGFVVLRNKFFQLTPYLGYGFHWQSLSLTDFEINNGEESLNSSYKTKWNGIMYSLDADFFLTKKLQLNTSFKYTQGNYRGQANWNLISSFKHPLSFEHIAKGYRLKSEVQVSKAINSSYSVYINGGYYFSNTGAGIDYLYLETDEVVKTKLNRVRGSAYSVNIGAKYNFNYKKQY